MKHVLFLETEQKYFAIGTPAAFLPLLGSRKCSTSLIPHLRQNVKTRGVTRMQCPRFAQCGRGTPLGKARLAIFELRRTKHQLIS